MAGLPNINGRWERYVHFLFLLFIGMLSWWLVGLDGRMNKELETRQALERDIAAISAAAMANNAEVLRRLEQIDKTVMIMDQRVYVLFGARPKDVHSP